MNSKQVSVVPNLRVVQAHLDINRVAVLLDMSSQWVKQRIKAGELEGFRLGGKIVVPVNSINEYLENRRITPGQS